MKRERNGERRHAGFPDREEREGEKERERELTEKKSFFPSAAVLEGKRHRAERRLARLFSFFAASIFRSCLFKMMNYMTYERKMNSIYDMVGEGKYKVRKKEQYFAFGPSVCE